MAGEKNIKKDESVATELKSDTISKSAEHDVALGKDGTPSDSTASIATLGDAASGMKGETAQESVGELGAHTGPTVYYNYYYPGYNGSFSQVDNNGYIHADGSQTGMQAENGSLLYYMPGYDSYAAGTLVGVDGQCVGQQPYFSSSVYLEHPVSYGSEAMPCYSWDSTFVADTQNGNADGIGNNVKYGGSTAFAKLNSFKNIKTDESITNKFSKSSYAQPTKSFNKVPQLVSAGLSKGYNPLGKSSAFSSYKQGLFPQNDLANYKTNGRLWNGNDRFKLRDNLSRNGGFEMATEITRGPRSQNKSSPLDSSIRKEGLGVTLRKDQYNLPDFQIEYEKAKFYVIKSYNEDDIHKCIKYNVWASTPNGNKKLDAAFHEAEVKADENGTRCPIFLFFSVNGSGQFIGVAEMMGKVDFNKDMDFWKLDKWNGFFPVKWHMIKDIPNFHLRHITLENNDNKPVTHSRDTQEIELKQGLELLEIFKNYAVKTSLLDDFNFYENREKSHQGKKTSKPASQQMEIFKDNGFTKHIKAEEKKHELDSISLINLTENLSLQPCTQNSEAVKNPVDNSISSVIAP